MLGCRRLVAVLRGCVAVSLLFWERAAGLRRRRPVAVLRDRDRVCLFFNRQVSRGGIRSVLVRPWCELLEMRGVKNALG